MSDSLKTKMPLSDDDSISGDMPNSDYPDTITVSSKIQWTMEITMEISLDIRKGISEDMIQEFITKNLKALKFDETKNNFVGFCSHKREKYSDGDLAIFSNWSEEGPIINFQLPSFFKDSNIIDKYSGKSFPTAEHAIMLCKALLFEDYVNADLLVPELTPEDVKHLGKKMKFSQEKWNSHCELIAKHVVYEKFKKNQALFAILEKFVQNGGFLVETADYDKIWGVFLDTKKDVDRWKDFREWKGYNILGFSIMHVYYRIKDEK